MQYAPKDARPTKCPTDNAAIQVTRTVGEVFDDGAESEDGGPTSWFDCDAAVQCTEPQYWSFRRPEMVIPSPS